MKGKISSKLFLSETFSTYYRQSIYDKNVMKYNQKYNLKDLNLC